MLNRLAVAILLFIPFTGWSQVLRLQTRDFKPGTMAPSRRTARPSRLGARHYLVLFESYPGAEMVAELTRRRIQVLSYVPDNALMVSAISLNLQGLGVQWYGLVSPGDKISPLIGLQVAGGYIVIFQPDSNVEFNRQLVLERGFTIVENPSLLPSHLLVTGAESALLKLAELDSVAYILPASAELQGGQEMIGCAGSLTQAGPVAAFVRASAGWAKDSDGKVNLQYFVQSVTPRVSETLGLGEIARAFAEWERWANLTFTATLQVGASRSIDVLFSRWSHGDSYPFDGPGGALAHTFYPTPDSHEPLAGDIHMDSDETWRVGASVDIFSVTLHELGHALGLAHADNPSSVMYPYYRQQAGLTAGDIAAIQALYGQKGTSGAGGTPITKPPTSTPPATTPTPVTSTSSKSDVSAPGLKFTYPTSTVISAYSATMGITGTASDNVGVTAVKWTTSNGDAGAASGTTNWSATIPLLVGDNVVTVRVYDSAGNSSWRAITVVRH